MPDRRPCIDPAPLFQLHPVHTHLALCTPGIDVLERSEFLVPSDRLFVGDLCMRQGFIDGLAEGIKVTGLLFSAYGSNT